MDSWWDDNITQMAIPFIRFHSEGRDLFTDRLFPSSLLNELYIVLIRQKGISRMEELSEEEKLYYWKKAKETGHRDKKRLIKIARSIYVCEKINHYDTSHNQ